MGDLLLKDWLCQAAHTRLLACRFTHSKSAWQVGELEGGEDDLLGRKKVRHCRGQKTGNRVRGKRLKTRLVRYLSRHSTKRNETVTKGRDKSTQPLLSHSYCYYTQRAELRWPSSEQINQLQLCATLWARTCCARASGACEQSCLKRDL